MGFTDMMTSARGPGLIGLLLGLLILGGFGILLLFSTDERFLGGEQTIESVIAHQQKDIEGLESTMEAMRKTLDALPALKSVGKELELARREKLFATDKVTGLRTSIAAAKDAITAKAKELEEYREKYRVFARAQAKGMTIARLETRDGTVYENVTVKDVNAVGMQISHNEGGRRIAFEQLPDDLQDRFQFDPGKKAEALALEKAQLQAHEESVDSTLAAVKARADRQREADAMRKRQDTLAAIDVKELRVRSIEEEIKDLDRSIALESAKRISNAPQLRARQNEKKQALDALRADISRLKASL